MFPKGGMGGLLKQAQEMQKKMNQYHSIDNEIKTISVEGFKPNE